MGPSGPVLFLGPVMATYERDKLVRAVLIELGVIDANVAPEAADQTLVNDTAQQNLEGLYAEGLIPFDLDGDVPARFMRPLVQIVAGDLALAFGKAARADALRNGALAGRRELCRLRDVGDDGLTARAEYF
jgi:hypothetical protein